MLALAVFLAATPPGSLAGPRHTGIEGKTFLIMSYGIPVQIAPGVWVSNFSVQLPVSTAFTVLSSKSGHEIARATTDASGAFALPLHPGNYLLAPDPLIIIPGCSVSLEPIDVVVSPTGFTTVNIFYFKQGPCALVSTVPSP